MKISVVDFKSEKAQFEFVESAKNTGFCVLKNHGIDSSLIEEVFKEWHEFFYSKEEEKRKYLFKRDFHKVQDGFFPQEVSETAKGFSIKDLKEFFHYYHTGNLPECIGKTTIQMRKELISLGKVLLKWIEDSLPSDIKASLSMPLSHMVDEQYQTLLRILHYPPLPESFPTGSVRGAPHEDINLITLLVSPSSTGLQAQDNSGSWHSVPCDKNWIIVNIGDMLQEASHNYFKATTHRVINPEAKQENISRYSMPLFLHPREEVVLSPRYTAKKYLNERLHELGLL